MATTNNYNRQNNRQSSRQPQARQPEPEWITVVPDVAVKLSKGDYFSLSWYGAVIHGCAVRHGSRGPFISWPSFLGSAGNYVKRAYVYAERGSQTEETLDKVLQTVLHEQEEGAR